MPRGLARGTIVISINMSWNVVNFRSNLIRALIGQGYDVVALCPRDAYSARIEELGCRFIDVPMENKGTSPVADAMLLWRYFRIFLNLRPIAFLGYTIKPNIYGTLAARMLGIPAINNISGLGTTFIRETWLTKVVSILYRTALSRSAKVFFQNADDRALFVERGLVDNARTGLLPGSGIDLTRFMPRDGGAAREPGAAAFLLIARLLWDKGVGEFVEAARIVRQSHPKAKFRLAGMLDVQNRTAVDAKSVEDWVAEGLIDYAGALDDVRPAIAGADCVVLPSYREGAPRTLLEAAAMARPVITTNVPGCRDVVDAGVTGFLCEVRDAADLARAMIRMIELPAERRAAMGQAARAMVEARFDETLVLNAYIRELDAIPGNEPAVAGTGARPPLPPTRQMNR